MKYFLCVTKIINRIIVLIVNNLFKLYGTENIHDLLNVAFGDDYLSTVHWDTDKYNILENHFHPIHFKIIPWKTERPVTSASDIISIEKNKIVDDTMIVEKSIHLDCFDLCRTNDTFQTKVYGIKVAFHNETEKKTIIVSGLVDDLLITCIDNVYLNIKMEIALKASTLFTLQVRHTSFRIGFPEHTWLLRFP